VSVDELRPQRGELMRVPDRFPVGHELGREQSPVRLKVVQPGRPTYERSVRVFVRDGLEDGLKLAAPIGNVEGSNAVPCSLLLKWMRTSRSSGQ